MLFSELRFWGFFSVVAALYLVLPHRWQNRMLLVASAVFYGAWDWRFLALIFSSIAVDYTIALRLQATAEPSLRKRLLMVSLVYNLGVLAVFKYLGFFVESFTGFLATLGLTANPVLLAIVLPVGISFYTFQSLSYTIDVWRGQMRPVRDFGDFALYVMFFPQLVAGPIERAQHLLPEILHPRQVTWEGVGRGAVLCLLGLVKKIVIADAIAPSVDAVFAAPDPTGADVLVASWLFAVQIYCDFSGYTDIARGLARMLGFDLMRNFAQPYFAANPQEFWRRWHISLSTWLRDYLYVPLGGNRGSPAATYRNLMATMVLGGLWHGAAWNFVLWGLYQGGLLALHRALTGRLPRAPARPRSLGALLRRLVLIVLFFQVVCYGWLLFRAGSLEQVVDFTARLAGMAPALLSGQLPVLSSLPAPPFAALLGLACLVVWDLAVELTGDTRFYVRWPMPMRAATYAAMLYLLAFGGTTDSAAFIYFQF